MRNSICHPERAERVEVVARTLIPALVVLCALTAAPLPFRADPPSDWIDPATGHRVIRLSSEPGSQTLYFHDNQYSPDGDKYVFTSPSGIWRVGLTRLGAQMDNATPNRPVMVCS